MQTPNPAQTFLAEAADLLDQVEECVLEIEKRPDDRESVNRLFRAFHTIKGSGAMFGFDAVAAFTHHVETVLDRVRQGTVTISPELVSLILGARDHIQQLLAQGEGDPAVNQAAGSELASRLAALVGSTPADLSKAAITKPMPPDSGASGIATYRIRFRPNPGLPASGLDPAALLDDLRRLGECRVTLDAEAVPALESLTPTQCHLAWDIVLTTCAGMNAIRDVFIFAEDAAELQIEIGDSAGIAAAEPAGNDGVVPAPAVQTAVAAEPSMKTCPGSEPSSTATVKSIRDGVVRVPSAKLDHIVGLVGELVMNQSRLCQVSERLAVSDLTVPVEAIERLIAELRDSVLGIRMMPIGSTFSRFKRLVHDLSRDLGKDVDLVTEGGDTELDKTVLDQLADPLVHLIRNSIDHGIETPAERAGAGKPPRGTVRLTASHEGSHVLVTIQDDGRGLDAATIRAKAVEKQLIGQDAPLTEAEIFNLVFLPGFSTAKNVTAVSGRGVGMDVVRRQIDALRGAIQLSSTAGRGTTITLALPLTLAIIEGLLVTVGGDPFIIPMSVVMENVELQRSDRTRNNGRNLVTVRGELVPYLHLRELFCMAGDEPELEKIVITRFGHDRVGLVVDRVHGSHQTVIQSLGRMFRGIDVVSGGTILGDGRVALILDLSGIVAFDKARGGECMRSVRAVCAA